MNEKTIEKACMKAYLKLTAYFTLAGAVIGYGGCKIVDWYNDKLLEARNEGLREGMKIEQDWKKGEA